MSESEGESAPRRFVVDTNVFVAAIKPFSGRSRTARTDTGSLALLMRLVTDSELQLFGSLWLFDEYKRLAEELNSETSELILGRLTGKMREVAEIGDEAAARCRPYLPEREAADILHAATCLQVKAVLITNDGDFDRIKESGDRGLEHRRGDQETIDSGIAQLLDCPTPEAGYAPSLSGGDTISLFASIVGKRVSLL